MNHRRSPAASWQLDLTIGGKAVSGAGAALPVSNPATEQILAAPRQATVDQVHEAVAAARRAFDSGVWRDPELRRRMLNRFADEIKRRADVLREAIVEDVGTPVSLCDSLQISASIKTLRWFAQQTTLDRTRHLGPDGGHPRSESMIRYEPAGVVAAISAFNLPLVLAIAKIGAAWCAGCTVVVMPSPQAPLAVLMMGDIMRDIGCPPGVLNIVLGGPEIGRALTTHPDIDRVSFTGSVAVGKEIMRQAADGLKGIVLELGGKSAAIVLPQADIGAIALQLHSRYLRNAGQGCKSPTRILVPEERFDEFIAVSRKVFEQLPVGDPWDRSTVVGPLISATQRVRVEGYIERALGEGGRIIAGGGRPAIPRGWYLNPTLITCLTNQAEIARDELFGPVGVAMTYRTVDEAVQIANDTPFGLAGAVYGPLEEAKHVGARLRAGTIYINGGGGLRVDTPMSGWKQSGLGREWGEEGILEFLEVQHLQWPVD